MRGNDLTDLFAVPDEPVRFRQGTVATWDLFSGTGTVNVGGTVLSSVPFLSPGTAVLLLPGDTVILLRQGRSWFILGRVNSPGGINGIGRNTQATAGYSASASNFATTTGFVTAVTLNIPIPVWANAASAQVTLMLLARNSTGATDQFAGKINMPDGATSTWNSAFVPTVSFGSLTIGKAWGATVVTPGGTLAITGQILSGTAWAVNAGNAATLDALVTFNSNGS